MRQMCIRLQPLALQNEWTLHNRLLNKRSTTLIVFDLKSEKWAYYGYCLVSGKPSSGH